MSLKKGKISADELTFIKEHIGHRPDFIAHELNRSEKFVRRYMQEVEEELVDKQPSNNFERKNDLGVVSHKDKHGNRSATVMTGGGSEDIDYETSNSENLSRYSMKKCITSIFK